MNLSGLLQLIRSRRPYDQVVQRLIESRVALSTAPPAMALSVLDPAKPLVLAALQKDAGRPILVVVASEARARRTGARMVRFAVAGSTPSGA